VRESSKIWDRWLTLNTASQRNDKGPDYYVFQPSASGQDVPPHLREAAAALKGMLEGERRAFLKQHYESTLKGGAKASNVDENADLEALGVAGNDNPDLSSGGV
jgi:hypothetical protein